MKLSYKDTLQYKEDNKSFKVALGVSISFFMIFFLVFLVAFFFLKKYSLEKALAVLFYGSLLYLVLDLPFIIITIMAKREMNSIKKNMDDVYVFQSRFKYQSNHWRFQSKYTVWFEYKNETKKLTTSWLYDSNNLENSLVIVGYIESLDKIIVIRKC